MNLPHVLIGSGGHAKVLLDVIYLRSEKILGFTDINNKEGSFFDLPPLGDDSSIYTYPASEILLINGIGHLPFSTIRKKIYETFKAKGYHFAKIVHPSAVIGFDVTLAEGVQVMAGAILQPSAKIGQNTIINTRVSVDHDCQIGNYVHIAPGTTVSGGVIIEDDVFVGAGSTIINGIRIGNGSVIGAGSVVVRDIPAFSTVMGIPAKEKKNL